MAYGGIFGQKTIVDAFTKDETLTQSVANLFGLGSDYTPNNVFQILAQAALYKTVTPATQLGTLPEGSIIYLNENGSPVPFYVAKQGYEPSHNTDRVLIVRKDAVQTGAWNASGVNTYDGSTIDTWFNQTYLKTLDSDVQAAIATTNIPATSPYNSGVIRLTKSVFALSLTELGLSNSRANVEGSALPIASTLIANMTWTRSPYTTSNDDAWGVASGGEYSTNSRTATFTYPPAFTLPTTFTAWTEPPTTGLYDLSNNLLLTLPAVQIETGSYTGTGTYGSSNPNSLTFGFVPKLVVIQSHEAGYNGGAPWIYGATYGVYSFSTSGTVSANCTLTWSGNRLYWYNSVSSTQQLNQAGIAYDYIAVG